MAIDPAILERLKTAAGHGGWTQDMAIIEPHLEEWRGRYKGATPLMLMPASTEAVSRLLEIAHQTRTSIVPQGGNTGLVGGQIPSLCGTEVLLWLGRMNRVRARDALNDTMTVDAGCVLATIQAEAAAMDRLFPLSLASEGSAQIGGLISTNAGGTAVLAYGTMRDLVLGLEAVLPDGTVLPGLKGLRKDNTGYDLKQLFIGAEGTLGIVTGAVLKLWPKPRGFETALVEVSTPDGAIHLLAAAKQALGASLTGFELMPAMGLSMVLRHIAGTRLPFSAIPPWAVLIERTLHAEQEEPQLGQFLEDAQAKGLLKDAALAQSLDQRAQFWRLREALSEAQKFEGGSIKHDIAVPVSAMGDFIRAASEAVTRTMPGARIVAFGHVGDGNVHFNVSQPLGAETATFLARWEEISSLAHGIAHGLGGSISAEHGLGQMKAAEIQTYKSPAEVALMRALKTALDPHGIMNPGKVLPLSR